jgi:hypothetical protein
MKKITLSCSLSSWFVCSTLCAASLMFAQGPRGGSFGPMGGGFGPMGGRGMGSFGAGPHNIVTGAPYCATAAVQTQETLADGNRINNNRQSNVCRDGQGRIRIEQTVTPPAASGKPAFSLVTILDPVAGYRYLLNSSTMTALQSPLPKPRTPAAGSTLPANPPAPRTGPDGVTVTTTNLGSQTVNGVAATGTQITEVIPAGVIGNAQPIQIVRVTWISTELKVPVQIKSSDPRFGSTDMELTNIAQAEPSGSLFVVPAGYTVKSSGGHGMGGHGGPMGGGMGGAIRDRRPAPLQQ